MELKDRLGRIHNYLRISLTDKCNLRCTYCMPQENPQFAPQAHLMNATEVLQIAEKFVEAGVDKIRLTGGEPLVRKDIDVILRGLSQMPVQLTMTTNAVLLDKYFDVLDAAGCTHLNISLDTLDRQRFQEMTGRDNFDRVLNNILEAKRRNFNIKINTVLMKDVNTDEVLDLIQFFTPKDIPVRFIEFMPFKDNQWDRSKMLSQEEVLDIVYEVYAKSDVKKIAVGAHATAREFKLPDASATFGIISSVTNPFCDTCNRLRLTADGKLKNCLFSNAEVDLLTLHREGKDFTALVNQVVQRKAAVRAGMKSPALFENKSTHQHNRSMVRIGG